MNGLLNRKLRYDVASTVYVRGNMEFHGGRASGLDLEMAKEEVKAV
jgi:hypothetical protein